MLPYAKVARARARTRALSLSRTLSVADRSPRVSARSESPSESSRFCPPPYPSPTLFPRRLLRANYSCKSTSKGWSGTSEMSSRASHGQRTAALHHSCFRPKSEPPLFVTLLALSSKRRDSTRRTPLPSSRG